MCKLSNIAAMLSRAVIFLMVTVFVPKYTCQKNIVEELTERYYDDSTECFDAQNETEPLYKCSGIIIRAVRIFDDEIKFAWSLKPSDKEKNSFSFAFLRSDLRFSTSGFGLDAGFIIYPHLSTPREKNTQKVLCGYPINANSDLRSHRGCGPTLDDKTETSRQCNAQNITTFPQWLSLYNKLIDNPDLKFRQCSFDLSSNSVAIRNFVVVREANLYIQNNSELAFSNNELRLEGWNENDVKKIPIQSFFYIMDTEKGYAHALKYQNDFYIESDGEIVPIVGIRLPTPSNPNIEIQKVDTHL